MKKIFAILAATTLLALGGAVVASASTPSGTISVGGIQSRTVQTGAYLTTSYQALLPQCPDSTWTAVSGGYYYDYPAPAADDISIRANQRDINGSGVQGWLIDSKSLTGGNARAIVVEVTCIKLA